MHRPVLAAALLACAVGALLGVPAFAKHKRKARDRDHDGLRDRVEVKRFHTSPRRKDTDRDALKDGAEVKRFHTKPRRKDTDRDGLKDGAEVKRFHTNPRRRDTDGDGLTDGAEVKRYHTNPRRKDTDGDGVSDGDEVRGGTSPTNPRGTPPRPPTSSPGKTPPRPCKTVVGSAAAAQAAVAAAAPGAVVCLANGSYGRVNLNASKSGEVMLQAQTPGGATIAGATLSGSNLTVSRFRMTGSFDASPGSTGMRADHNFFDLNAYNGYGVMACASTSTTCNDVSVTNNRFIGRAEEDAIRANRYHDGPDAGSNGLLVQGNEFAGNQEAGDHNDVFQSVYAGDHLTFRRNYLHDFGGQGFFVKDQDYAINGLVAEDNLIVRQNLPCIPASLCPNFQLSPFQIFGPLANVSIRHNTIWPGSGGTWLRGSGWAGPTVFADNIVASLNSDATGLTTGYTASNNTRCGGSGFPAAGVVTSCAPAFAGAALGDYRIPGGRGVSWTVAQGDFGP